MKITSLKNLPIEQNTHNPKISKKVWIEKGQIPKLTNLTQATFPPGEVASEHFHQDMYEIFLIEKGSGTIKINGVSHQIKKGDCILIEPDDLHEVNNSSKSDLVITYLGIEV